MAEPAWDADLAVDHDDLMAFDEHNLPCSDGMPMADSSQQREAMRYTYGALRPRYGDDVAVFEDMLVYYVPKMSQDGPMARVAPDVFVSFGVGARHRSSYVIWQEGKPPDFVLEVVSQSSGSGDYGRKREIYQHMGVKEYFIFDSRDRPRRYRLTAFELEGGAYRTIPGTLLPDGRRGIRSALLGLVACVIEERTLRWHDPALGEDLLSPPQKDAVIAEQGAQLAAKDADLAAKDAEIAALRAALASKASG